MKVKLPGVRRIGISGEFIKLDALLKFAALVSTGGEAKAHIGNGDVYVDGEPCLLRGKKIRAGNVVRFGGDTLLVEQSRR